MAALTARWSRDFTRSGRYAPRSGRPRKQNQKTQEATNLIVRDRRFGRELTCADIAGFLSERNIDISAATVWRCLRAYGFNVLC